MTRIPTARARRLLHLVLAGASVLALAACSQSAPAPAAPAASTSATPTSTDTPSATADPSAPPASPAPVPAGGWRLLWPFATEAEARAWQDSSGGHQPWHLDPEETALGFTAALGLNGIDRSTSVQVTGDQAWVGVGHALPDGRVATAAVVHLVRIGSGDGAPWEVVGTRDDTLTLDTPPYGGSVSSPVTVGGLITGVDESLRVQVRRTGTAELLGESCCLPAGGEKQRWSTPVTFNGRGPVTILVTTGGHVADVEQFAVTGVTAG